ncbi:helix-turn-helix domain-containing protein [Streptomyces sp. NRRL F-5650]|uniref:helix-turn-helix domain-containing protein n=1 Tax=Streptomyces sp. NRRL F-5650 TaxID=1463868 RepID=UPI0004C6C42E|nr:helix-turn-helix transcriptional regulator [Streptomyces sp. NRRL F-5650]
MDTIVLNVTAFEAVTSAQGHTTYEQQTAATGLSVGVLHRLRNGGPASPMAIARICSTYGARFDELFEFRAVTTTRRNPRPVRRRVKAAAA